MTRLVNEFGEYIAAWRNSKVDAGINPKNRGWLLKVPVFHTLFAMVRSRGTGRKFNPAAPNGNQGPPIRDNPERSEFRAIYNPRR